MASTLSREKISSIVVADLEMLMSRAQATCLLIGAHAVVTLGYIRNTVDFDLLVSEGNRSHWLDLIRQIVRICALDLSDESFRALILRLVAKMDSRESNSLPNDRKSLAADLNLPVFEQPQAEHWSAKMS